MLWLDVVVVPMSLLCDCCCCGVRIVEGLLSDVTETAPSSTPELHTALFTLLSLQPTCIHTTHTDQLVATVRLLLREPQHR